MNIISREELKEKLDRGDNFKLVMAMGEWAYRAQHIPGSINISTPEEAMEILDKTEEIIVYCSSAECPASQYAYHVLDKAGYKNLRRFSGGLADWADAGYPLEGEQVT